MNGRHATAPSVKDQRDSDRSRSIDEVGVLPRGRRMWRVAIRIAGTVLLGLTLTACRDSDDAAGPGDLPEVNNALRFDGSSTYIEIPGIATQQPPTLTLEMMVKFDSTHLITAPLATTADESLQVVRGGYSVTCSAGIVHWKVFRGHDVSSQSNASLPADTSAWHHLAFAYYYGQSWTYIDGLLADRVPLVDMTLRPVYYEGDRLLIGMSRGGGAGGAYFKGQIDEIRLWSVVRTPEQIRTFSTRMSDDHVTNLVGYWNFDGAQETGVVRDRSLTENHGRLRGRAEIVRSTAFGK